jgi:hypothetical protein
MSFIIAISVVEVSQSFREMKLPGLVVLLLSSLLTIFTSSLNVGDSDTTTYMFSLVDYIMEVPLLYMGEDVVKVVRWIKTGLFGHVKKEHKRGKTLGVSIASLFCVRATILIVAVLSIVFFYRAISRTIFV